jgi:uncharacterized protein YbcV (DUF1398 family)
VSETIELVRAALAEGTRRRPQAEGFPVFAQALREAGVRRNHRALPSGQSTYWTDLGCAVLYSDPVAPGAPSEVASFDADALVAALRIEQAGDSTFPEFLRQAWAAGVLEYVVDFESRTCTYVGRDGRAYVESYRAAAGESCDA